MRYLLPCDCGEKIAVVSGQSGSTVICTCGRTLDVPPLRDMQRLKSVADIEKQAAQTKWSGKRGTIFLGIVFLTGGVLFGGWLQFSRPQSVDIAPVRTAILASSPPAAFEMFRMSEEFGINVVTPEEAKVQAQNDKISRWINLALAIIVVGLVFCAAGYFWPSSQGAVPVNAKLKHPPHPPRPAR